MLAPALPKMSNEKGRQKKSMNHDRRLQSPMSMSNGPLLVLYLLVHQEESLEGRNRNPPERHATQLQCPLRLLPRRLSRRKNRPPRPKEYPKARSHLPRRLKSHRLGTSSIRRDMKDLSEQPQLFVNKRHPLGNVNDP